MYGDWVEIVCPLDVTKIIYLVNADSNPDSLKEYLMIRFHKVLQNRAVKLETFDDESTKLLINLIRSNSSDQGAVYMFTKMYVYHTYMVAYHQMNNDEYRLLRFKLRRVLDPLAVY